jgi:spore germination cell wall hydrolase CwlJ-like protein
MDANDVHSLALCAWKEARGEHVDGCRAVMHVIRNRVGAPGFAHTLHDVIYGKNQFTSMSVPSDPEFNLEPSSGDGVFAECLAIAEGIEGDPDLTNGARYYANVKNVTSGWFFRAIIGDPAAHPIVAQVGHHTFYA